MPTLFWDASGLAKRYTVEIGSDVADDLFAFVPTASMLTTVWGYAEAFSILLWKRNDQRIDTSTFHTATMALRQEIIDSRDINFLTIDESVVLAGLSLMERHNINATDASLLAALLRYCLSRRSGSPVCVMVAADKRLLRAAQAGGLQTLDMEVVTVATLPAFLAAL